MFLSRKPDVHYYYLCQLIFRWTRTIFISEDQVYLEEETHREEYVLSETGRIWLGTVGKFCVRPWNFGQVHELPYLSDAVNLHVHQCYSSRLL